MTTARRREWQPGVYLAFADFRARPAHDLLSRIAIDKVPGRVYDLGCGAGNVTAMLTERWPERSVIGLDSSPAMIAEAHKRYPQPIVWQQDDIATWQPSAPPALIFSNAALHWVPDHRALLPRLLAALASGGQLAAQMPNTAAAPYRACLTTLLSQDPWRARLADVATHPDPLPADAYYPLLAGDASEIDIWETHYIHPLDSLDAVVAWVSGAALTPYLSVLADDEKAEFLAGYKEVARATYPPQADGKVLFTMRRLFIVARRR